MLEEERKKIADKDEELEALHAQLANQKRALVQQLESIEKVLVCVRVSVCLRVCVSACAMPHVLGDGVLINSMPCAGCKIGVKSHR